VWSRVCWGIAASLDHPGAGAPRVLPSAPRVEEEEEEEEEETVA